MLERIRVNSISLSDLTFELVRPPNYGMARRSTVQIQVKMGERPSYPVATRRHWYRLGALRCMKMMWQSCSLKRLS
jgi:hypothetical protein